jgi:hypothetical protein
MRKTGKGFAISGDKRVPAFLIRFEEPLTSILSSQAGEAVD